MTTEHGTCVCGKSVELSEGKISGSFCRYYASVRCDCGLSLSEEIESMGTEGGDPLDELSARVGARWDLMMDKLKGGN